MELKHKFTYIYYYFFCFIVIIASGSLIGYRIGMNAIDIFIVVIGAPLILKLILIRRNLEKLIIIVTILMIYFLLNFLNYPVTWIKLFRYITILLIMVAVGMHCKSKNINIQIILYNIILFFASYSLFLFLLINILKLPIPYIQVNPFNSITPYRSYFDIYYSLSSINIGGKWILRNNSIFWEPGVYQIYLNFALYAFLFLKVSKRRRDFVILILSILSTFSTTGIMLAAILIVYRTINISKTNKTNISIKIVISSVLLVTIIFVFTIILSEKLHSSRQSFESRTSDIELGLKTFSQSPLIGHGYFNESAFFGLQRDNNVYWSYERGNSNGIINLAYMQGLIGLLLYFYPLINSKTSYINKSCWIGFLLFFLISNMTEPVFQTSFMLLWVGHNYGSLLIGFKNQRVIRRDKGDYK